ALHEGITACSTPKRLTLLFSSPSLARSDLLNVLHAWQFLATLRLRWQTGPDLDPAVPNGVRPDLLSGLQRQQLKEALRVIKLAQRGVAQTYRMGY
ncbi:MAG: putative nucleotidyltransferase substrate binding domain-containing protein, partial [Natronospirillum sp.]